MNNENPVTLVASEISTNQKPFVCDICQKEFLTKVHYRVHSFIHLFSEPSDCDQCHEDFTHIVNLDKHLAAHTNQECITCQLCKKEFSDIDSFNEHAETHSIKPDTTSIVKREFENENAVGKVLENGNYSLCNDISGRNKFEIHQLEVPRLTRHIKQEVDPDEFIEMEFVIDNLHAADEDEFFPSDSLDVTENDVSSQNSQMYETVKSSTEVKNRQYKNTNENRRNPKNLKPFICTVCQKVFKNKHSLAVHSLTHSDEKIYSCILCEKKFALKCLLKAHIRTHKVRQFFCALCQKGFVSKDKLLSHVYVHAVVGSFSCNVCEMTFPKKSLLEKHHLSHVTKKEFSCDVCQKKYSSEKALNNHKHTHSKLSEFVSSKSNLETCSYTHEKHHFSPIVKKEFTCDICQKRYSSEKALDNHKHTHSKLSEFASSNLKTHPFVCNICNRKFILEQHLQSHLELVHQK